MVLKGSEKDRDDYPAPDEGAETVGESVVKKVATPSKAVKRSTRGKKSKKTKAAAVAKVAVAEASKTTAIVSVWSGRVTANDCPSGASYAWDAPGSVVQVAAEDVDVVMGKNRSGTRECCGSGTERIYFVFAD